tara:strand:- start:484 stop:1269 length:786 start_codon:yes stop_codon:yes gene_type:complete
MLGLGNSLTSSGYSAEGWYSGASIRLDGADDYVEFDDFDGFTPGANSASGFSFSVWVRFNGSVGTSGQRIMSKRPISGSSGIEWAFQTSAASKPRFLVYFGSDTSNRLRFDMNVTLGHSTWYNIIVAWDLSKNDSSGITGWVNGVEYAGGTAASTYLGYSGVENVENGTEPLRIGRSVNVYGGGNYDEISMYDHQISAIHAAAIYNDGAPADRINDNGLTFYSRMGENLSGGNPVNERDVSVSGKLVNNATVETESYAGAE